MSEKCTHADYLTTNMYCLECDRDVSNYYVGRHLYDAQVERIAELEANIAASDNLLAQAMEGRSDEVHCGCCAPLRAEVVQLTGQCEDVTRHLAPLFADRPDLKPAGLAIVAAGHIAELEKERDLLRKQLNDPGVSRAMKYDGP